MKNKGFTVIEILVIVAVLSLLTTILLLNIRTGQNQIILFREQTKIIGILSRAKYLAISTFGREGVPCGYGVHFNKTSGVFLIFKDLAVDCGASDKKYSGASEIYESYQLDPAVMFDGPTSLDVLFIPPEPLVVITPTQDPATIVVKPIGAENQVFIKINSAGQIST